MLTGVIISQSAETASEIRQGIEQLGHVSIARVQNSYPEVDDLKRMLSVAAPEIVFLGVTDMPAALAVAAQIELLTPGIQLIAFGSHCRPEVLLELMRAGIREFLPLPLDRQTVIDCLARVSEILEKNPLETNQTNLLFSFLPAKPGVGTSTMALNFTVALSRIINNQVLLADFDLNQGLIAFMLKMDAKNSVVEAAERSMGMEETLWAQLVLKRDKMDILGSGVLRPGVRIEPAQVRYLLDFCRRIYGAVSLDLSGNMEKYSLEIMQESKLIFMVTTPEIPSLHLARGKIRFLEGQGLGDRIRLLLNRTAKRDAVTSADVEKLLGVPLYATFPNDYVRVHHALTMGKEVDAKSELGKRFDTLARLILDVKREPKPAKRLADYFSVVQARFN